MNKSIKILLGVMILFSLIMFYLDYQINHPNLYIQSEHNKKTNEYNKNNEALTEHIYNTPLKIESSNGNNTMIVLNNKTTLLKKGLHHE